MGRPKKELVDHPSHYQQDGRRECIVEMEEVFGVQNTAIWCMMTAFKYLYRKGRKEGNSAEQDIDKANWYMEHVDYLKEKWHTESFDVRMEQQLKQEIKEAKKAIKRQKKAAVVKEAKE